TAMLDYRAERGPEQLLRNTLLTAGCTLLVALALFLIWWTGRRVTRRIERRYQSAVEKIETGSFRFISAVSIWKAVHAAFRIVVLLLALALVIVGIHFVL